MRAGLVVVGLLLGAGYLLDGVEAFPWNWFKPGASEKRDAFTVLESYISTQTQFGHHLGRSLYHIKKLNATARAYKYERIDKTFVDLVNHAAELDLDDVCRAGALNHLKGAAVIIRAINNKTFKPRVVPSNLAQIFNTIAHKTQKDCYPELESKWSLDVDQSLERNFGESLKPLGDFMEHYRDTFEIHNEDAQALSGALDRLNDPTLEDSIGPRVKSMLEAMAKKSLEGSRENTAAKAEQMFKDLVLEPCEQFSRQDVVKDTIAVLVDMVWVSTSKDFKPDPRINQWAVRYAGCLWFQKVDLHELSKRVASSSSLATGLTT